MLKNADMPIILDISFKKTGITFDVFPYSRERLGLDNIFVQI